MLAFYKVTNKGSRVLWARRRSMLTPDQAGIFFNKMQCFCFTPSSASSREKTWRCP